MRMTSRVALAPVRFRIEKNIETEPYASRLASLFLGIRRDVLDSEACVKAGVLDLAADTAISGYNFEINLGGEGCDGERVTGFFATVFMSQTLKRRHYPTVSNAAGMKYRIVAAMRTRAGVNALRGPHAPSVCCGGLIWAYAVDPYVASRKQRLVAPSAPNAPLLHRFRCPPVAMMARDDVCRCR